MRGPTVRPASAAPLPEPGRLASVCGAGAGVGTGAGDGWIADGGVAAAGAAAGRRYSPAIGAALGLGVALGGSAFSRSHEYEADRLGLLYSARAGYDPNAGQRFWDRMEAQQGGAGGPSFLSTHPSYGDRRQRLATLVREDPDIVQAIQTRRRTG